MSAAEPFHPPRVAVVYLARTEDGVQSMAEFAETYRRYPAGINHDLIIIIKGTQKRGAYAATKIIFEGMANRFVEISDEGFDIQAYLNVSTTLDHEFICFLNTYTQILSPSWLRKMFDHVERDGVGIVGATGSYESLYDSIAFISKAVWLGAVRDVRFSKRLHDQFSMIMTMHAPGWTAARNSVRENVRRAIADRSQTRLHLSSPELEKDWDIHWAHLISDEGPLKFYRQFQRFPNPHLRSNAFLMRRDLLLSLKFSLGPTKYDCIEFESGPYGLPARLRGLGLRPLLVGANGVGYEIEAWPLSKTFRLEDQQNLLTSDNQVRNFAGFPTWERVTHARITWGEYVGPPAPGFIDLGFSFLRNSSLLEGAGMSSACDP